MATDDPLRNDGVRDAEIAETLDVETDEEDDDEIDDWDKDWSEDEDED